MTKIHRYLSLINDFFYKYNVVLNHRANHRANSVCTFDFLSTFVSADHEENILIIESWLDLSVQHHFYCNMLIWKSLFDETNLVLKSPEVHDWPIL